MRKVFDMHLHFAFEVPIEQSIAAYKETFNLYGVERMAFLSLCFGDRDDGKMILSPCCNLRAMAYKKAFSSKGYAFAHLIHYHPFKEERPSDEEISKEYLNQVKEYYNAGFDGMKMFEAQPTASRFLEQNIDEKVYDKFFDFAEEKGFPIIMHHANPAVNWNEESCSDWVKQHGNFYDESFPTKEEFHNQLFRRLEKNPKLKIILAHMGFYSHDRTLAERFLSYPNTMLDTTPGGEQLVYMSNRWDIWKSFFEKYYQRITFGTDTYNTAVPLDNPTKEWLLIRPTLVKNFFENNGNFDYVGSSYVGRGKDFTSEMIDAIYFDNALRYFGEPKEINDKYIKKTAKQLLKEVKTDYDKNDLEYILNLF